MQTSNITKGCTEAFKDKWKGRVEKKWRRGLCINFKKAVLPPALKTVQMLLFLTQTPLPLTFFFFAWCLWWSIVKGAGAIKATAVCYRLQNLGPSSIRQPQSSYLRGPCGNLVHWRKNIWSFSFARINSHTNDRWERGKGSRRTGGWWWGAWGSEEEHQRDKTKAALDLVKRIPTSVLNTVPLIFQCTANVYQEIFSVKTLQTMNSII